MANLARHLAPGGVLAIEPWLYPEFEAAYAAAGLSCDFVDPDFGRGLVVGQAG